MPGLNLAAGAVLAVALAISSCSTKRSRIQPLAPDLERWITDSRQVACSGLQGRFRIAAGVQASLRSTRYRQALLHELAGPGRPPMDLGAAKTLADRSAGALGTELARRCPDKVLKHREDIVYIPQQY